MGICCKRREKNKSSVNENFKILYRKYVIMQSYATCLGASIPGPELLHTIKDRVIDLCLFSDARSSAEVTSI
jgi:hypothetical protein